MDINASHRMTVHLIIQALPFPLDHGYVADCYAPCSAPPASPCSGGPPTTPTGVTPYEIELLELAARLGLQRSTARHAR